MAVVDQEEAPLELESGEDQVTERPLGAFTRPGGGGAGEAGCLPLIIRKSGLCMERLACFFFIIGGIYALFMRLQLARPNNSILSGNIQSSFSTMHGVVMDLSAAIPLGAAFFSIILFLSK